MIMEGNSFLRLIDRAQPRIDRAVHLSLRLAVEVVRHPRLLRSGGERDDGLESSRREEAVQETGQEWPPVARLWISVVGQEESLHCMP